MANNVQATAGSGTTFKTTDNAGVHTGHVNVDSVSGTVTVDGSGVTQPVSGTVTANLSATDNTVLDNIEAGIDETKVLIGAVNAAKVTDPDAASASGTALLRGIMQTVSDGNVALGQATKANSLPVAIASDDDLYGAFGALTDAEESDFSAASAALLPLIRGILHGLQPATIFRSIDLDESEEQIKGSAGRLIWVHAINLKASPLYLKFYNLTSANTTVGTSTPVLTFPVPTLGDTNGAGFVFTVPSGITFDTAITAAATTGIADNDTGAPGANELILNAGYV